MDIDILSLFPGYFAGPFDESIIKQARQKGLIDIRHVNVRDFAPLKHRKVDERPFGGGPGMVMMVEPIAKAIKSVKTEKSHVVYLSPQGSPLTAQKCRELASYEHLILLCGHYEGVDERVIEAYVDEEISIGDYVLTNGALAAIVVVDAVVRFVPGVLGAAEGSCEDSFEKGILDCPHYTKPLEFEGRKVPDVLLSGNHQEIAKWRGEEALKKTYRVRKDLYLTAVAEEERRTEIDGESIAMTFLVPDVKKSAAFYRKVLRFSVDFESESEVRFSQGLGFVLGASKRDEKVFTLFAKRERFDELARRIIKAKKALGKLQIKAEGREELAFTDDDGVLWVLRLSSHKERKNEQLS